MRDYLGIIFEKYEHLREILTGSQYEIREYNPCVLYSFIPYIIPIKDIPLFPTKSPKELFAFQVGFRV